MTKKLIEALVELYNAASAGTSDLRLSGALSNAAVVVGEVQREADKPTALRIAQRLSDGVFSGDDLRWAASELRRRQEYERMLNDWEEKTQWAQALDGEGMEAWHRADVIHAHFDRLAKERDAALAVGDANARSGASWAACVRELQERVALLEARQKCQRMGLHQIAEPVDESADDAVRRIVASIKKIEHTNADVFEAAVHLLRLLAENADLRAQLSAVGAGGVQSLQKGQK